MRLSLTLVHETSSEDAALLKDVEKIGVSLSTMLKCAHYSTETCLDNLEVT